MNLFFLPLVTLLALTTALPALPFTNHSAAAVIKRTLASGGTVPAETFHSEVLSSAAECGEKDWDRAPDGNDGWCPETSEDNNKCQFLANLWVSGIFYDCNFLWIRDNNCGVLARKTWLTWSRYGSIEVPDIVPHTVKYEVFQSRVPVLYYDNQEYGFWDWHWKKYSNHPSRQNYFHWFDCPNKS